MENDKEVQYSYDLAVLNRMEAFDKYMSNKPDDTRTASDAAYAEFHRIRFAKERRDLEVRRIILDIEKLKRAKRAQEPCVIL